MSRSSCPSEQIEEIDLSASPRPRIARNHNRHFDVQLYVLNYRQSLKNDSTVWHRDTDGSFRAMEWTSRFMYCQDRKAYLDRDGQVDHEWADEKWQQWSERDFHPAVEAYNQYNEPAPELIVLGNVNENLQKVDDTLKKVQARLYHAQSTLGLSIHPSGLHNSDNLLAQTREVFKDVFEDMRTHLRIASEAHRVSEEQMKSLGLAIRSLIRSKKAAERSQKKREAEDEKMVDTVKFLKECLNNHCRLVDMVLGWPEPLVQQGTDLIQAMLSEMFGLPIEEPYAETSETESELYLDLEAEEESDIEVLWEKTETEDFMDIDQDDESEFELDKIDKDPIKRPGKLGLRTMAKSRRLLQQEKHQKAKSALYQRFGLSVISEPSTDQEEAFEKEQHDFKRQRMMTNTLYESPERNPSPIKKRPVLRQTTLSFDKVRKSRRLFSRKELSQKGTAKDEEEAEEASPASARRYPRRTSAKRQDYRENGLFMYGWKFERTEDS